MISRTLAAQKKPIPTSQIWPLSNRIWSSWEQKMRPVTLSSSHSTYNPDSLWFRLNQLLPLHSVRSREAMGSPPFNNNSWVQRDHLASMTRRTRPGRDLFVKHSKASGIMCHNRQMNVIFFKVRLRMTKLHFLTRWFFLSLNCHAWAAQMNQMLKCYPARCGGCSPCACCWCMSFFFSLQGLAAIYLGPSVSPPCRDQLHGLLSPLSRLKLTM